jgi:predicted O-linked N-acetylglucosamine transferase (SPINDLY family)
LSLSADRAALHGYRAYLEGSRDSNPLFDTKAFARDWEALLLTIYSHAAGIEA